MGSLLTETNIIAALISAAVALIVVLLQHWLSPNYKEEIGELKKIVEGHHQLFAQTEAEKQRLDFLDRFVPRARIRSGGYNKQLLQLDSEANFKVDRVEMLNANKSVTGWIAGSAEESKTHEFLLTNDLLLKFVQTFDPRTRIKSGFVRYRIEIDSLQKACELPVTVEDSIENVDGIPTAFNKVTG